MWPTQNINCSKKEITKGQGSRGKHKLDSLNHYNIDPNTIRRVTYNETLNEIAKITDMYLHNGN